VLIKEHSLLIENFESMEVIPDDDPDLLRMEEIMKKLNKLNKED